MLRKLMLLVVLVSACGGKKDPAHGGSTTSQETAGAAPAGGEGEQTETKVIKEKGKVTIVTITKKKTAAPSPPDRPADPWPADPLVKFNVDRLNDYRKKHGVPPLKYDAKISAFATTGNKQLSQDHTAHAHFNAKIKSAMGDPEAMKGKSGFGAHAAENQGDWNGIPQLDPDPAKNGRKQIDLTLEIMHDEGPGGGHYENMLNPAFKRVGVGLLYVGPKLYMTNDFSD